MRTSFDLPADLREAMEQARIRDGYSAKRKSRWISEAVARLPSQDPNFASVGLSDGLSKKDTKLFVTLSAEAIEVIRSAKSRIRREDPDSEGLAGQIIRAAIRNRIKTGSGATR